VRARVTRRNRSEKRVAKPRPLRFPNPHVLTSVCVCVYPARTGRVVVCIVERMGEVKS
jgi:hypothetical protein